MTEGIESTLVMLGHKVGEELSSSVTTPPTLPASRRTHAGTGLGLDISRRIVAELHHGQIGIEPGPDGTVLSVRL